MHDSTWVQVPLQTQNVLECRQGRPPEGLTSSGVSNSTIPQPLDRPASSLCTIQKRQRLQKSLRDVYKMLRGIMPF